VSRTMIRGHRDDVNLCHARRSERRRAPCFARAPSAHAKRASARDARRHRHAATRVEERAKRGRQTRKMRADAQTELEKFLRSDNI
jgi:hypothetical protein